MANIVVPETVRVWKIGVDQANVQSWNNYTNNQGYNLFCTTNGKFLTWVDVNFGSMPASKLKEITRLTLGFPMG